jgi:hypothetical protein
VINYILWIRVFVEVVENISIQLNFDIFDLLAEQRWEVCFVARVLAV